MTITKTIKVPDDYRLFLELPRSIPSGVMANVNIDIPAISSQDKKSFWKEFDAMAAASQDEFLQDENFSRSN